MFYTSINIMGGLGNHLFQIAVLLFFKKRSTVERELVFKYEENLHNAHNLPRKTFWNTLFKNQFNVLSPNDFNQIHLQQCCAEQESHKYFDLPFQSQKNILFYGYFQSFIYIDDEIRKEMQNIIFSNKELVSKVQVIYDNIKTQLIAEDDDLISLHIRRTDFIYLKDFNFILDLDYYKKALQIAGKNKLVVFSDDIEWCKQNITHDLYPYENIYFVENNDVETDFLLMTKIKHNIIANSTFSTWASFASEYTQKIIIAPSKWYGVNGPKYHQQIYHKYITHIL